MKTDNIKYTNPSFTSIYRIKHTSSIDTTRVRNDFVKLAKFCPDTPILYAQGKCPFEPVLLTMANNIADFYHSNFNWINQNVTRHGKQLPNPDDMVSWVVSGFDDIKHVNKFIQNFSVPGSIKYFFKNLFSSSIKPNYDDKPEHLRTLFKRIDDIENANSKFEQHMKKQGKIIECEDIDEFIESFIKNEENLS